MTVIYSNVQPLHATISRSFWSHLILIHS
jgi:hypothetical protein